MTKTTKNQINQKKNHTKNFCLSLGTIDIRSGHEKNEVTKIYSVAKENA